MQTGLKDQYVIRQNKKMALGYTTGSCAAAAAKAAARMLLTGELQSEVQLMTPKGILLTLAVEHASLSEGEASCAVQKDAGDDPDVTHGIFVYASVRYGCFAENAHAQTVKWENRRAQDAAGVKASISLEREEQVGELNGLIRILGGTGVGRITKPGLEQAVGEAAINRVPRRMIREAVAEICEENGYFGPMEVEISIPEGVSLAAKTFNPRLGIVGGISVLGTSGIVEPMSETALIASIRVEMQMRRENGNGYLLAAPGNYGMEYLSAHFPFSLEQAVKYSNFVGEMIDFAVELSFDGVLLVSHIGKLIKVAGGIMNTHSRNADARMELLAANALRVGAGRETVCAVLEAVTTDEGLAVLKRDGLLARTMEQVMERVHFYLDHRAYGHLKIGVIAFSNELGTLGQAGPVEELMRRLEP